MILGGGYVYHVFQFNLTLLFENQQAAEGECRLPINFVLYANSYEKVRLALASSGKLGLSCFFEFGTEAIACHQSPKWFLSVRLFPLLPRWPVT